MRDKTYCVRHSLHEETQKLLANRPVTITLKDISEETGIHIRWLKDLCANKPKNPGVNPTQKLYEFLSGKTLTV